jgi:hypothetical protein
LTSRPITGSYFARISGEREISSGIVFAMDRAKIIESGLPRWRRDYLPFGSPVNRSTAKKTLSLSHVLAIVVLEFDGYFSIYSGKNRLALVTPLQLGPLIKGG